jgi:hypothetical protein
MVLQRWRYRLELHVVAAVARLVLVASLLLNVAGIAISVHRVAPKVSA